MDWQKINRKKKLSLSNMCVIYLNCGTYKRKMIKDFHENHILLIFIGISVFRITNKHDFKLNQSTIFFLNEEIEKPKNEWK